MAFKKVVSVSLLSLILVVSSAACSSSSGNTTNSTSTSEASSSDLPDFPIKNQADLALLKSKVNKSMTYDIVNSNPDSHSGEVIEWGGRVFVEPEKDEFGVYLQVYATGNDKNFIVGLQDPNFKVKKDDYVIVTGTVKGKFEGKNAFGANLAVPSVLAGNIELTTRSKAVAPAISSIPVNATNSQNGLDVTLTKVELAKDETRFYVKVTNGTGAKISLSTYNAKVIQGSKQLETKMQFDNKNEELPNDFLAGVTAEGILVFPAVEAQPKQLTLYFDKPYGGDWNIQWSEINLSAALP
ncbi:MAG: hypothetical protein ACYC6Z_06550 [Thermoleophilia bacterium]